MTSSSRPGNLQQQRPQVARVGLLRLRFADATLEDKYRAHHMAEFLPRLRRLLQVAVFLFVAFATVDALTLPAAVRPPVLRMYVMVIVPMLALTWTVMHVRQVRPWLQWIVGACALCIGLGIVGIIWIARTHAANMPYEGVIIATFCFYFLTGLRFVTAALCGWLVFVAYVGMELQVGLPGTTLAYNALFVATANVIGCFGSHYLEHALRLSFLSVQQLQGLAERDALTGLLNRRALGNRVRSIWRQAQRDRHGLAVAMVDVDHFKHYNDHYGHGAGDEALKAVAAVIASHARRPLDVCARFGGEEFIVVWYDVGVEQATALSERMRQGVLALGLPHAASPTSDRVTISTGLFCAQVKDETQWNAAVHAADRALYQAKQSGRNRVQCGSPA